MQKFQTFEANNFHTTISNLFSEFQTNNKSPSNSHSWSLNYHETISLAFSLAYKHTRHTRSNNFKIKFNKRKYRDERKEKTQTNKMETL